MKHFNRSAITVALVITLGAAFSVNAKAADSSLIENSISEMVIAQGQQVIGDFTLQLQQSISEEINRLNANFTFDESIIESLAFFTESRSESETNESEQATQPEAN
ncbi:hypothetical protein L3081_17350 [Colwellia sp. MSW7]|uniref:Uncharacterized protein n=1 Tax=Colwellia maritima TaxID=2912588 RepID=A0ABS9X443_9GAMM|nr:hypothetical protein [Colwellia maritima]MCI2284835.1 hypothetical protein [Colwellia maritima]